MPILTASGYISVKTASIWASKKLGFTSIISVTPVVFCAVRAVIALIANTPFKVIALISACIPAPPELSEPAIVRAVFIIPSFFS